MACRRAVAWSVRQISSSNRSQQRAVGRVGPRNASRLALLETTCPLRILGRRVEPVIQTNWSRSQAEIAAQEEEVQEQKMESEAEARTPRDENSMSNPNVESWIFGRQRGSSRRRYTPDQCASQDQLTGHQPFPIEDLRYTPMHRAKPLGSTKNQTLVGGSCILRPQLPPSTRHSLRRR